MAIRTFTNGGVNDFASTPGNWDTPPVDNDTIVISAGSNCCWDVDTSGWANGIAGFTITGHATTPAMVYFKTSGTTNYILIKTGTTLNGTAAATKGRLLANADGVWSNNNPYPFAAKATIKFITTAYLAGANLDVKLLCTEPANKVINFSANEAAGQTVLSVATNVTGDIWAAGDTVAICDLQKGREFETRVIAAGGIAATTITVTAGLTAAKTAGTYPAIMMLCSRNIRLIGGAGYSRMISGLNGGNVSVWAYCINADQGYALESCVGVTIGGHLGPGPTTGWAAGWAETVKSCSTCTISGTITGTVYGVNAGSNNIISGTISGCDTGAYLGVGLTINGTISGCGTGAHGSSGGSSGFTLNGTIKGCGIGLNAGSNHVVNGTIAGCSTGISSGFNIVVSGTVTGCTTGANLCTNIKITSSGIIITGSYGLYICTGSTMHGTISECSYGIYMGSGHVITGTISGGSYGVYFSSDCTFGGATLSNSVADLTLIPTAKLYNTSLNSPVELSQYNTNSTPDWAYVASQDHDKVLGAFKSWTRGGITISDTTPGNLPAGYAVVFVHMCTDATKQNFRQVVVSLLPGATLKVDGQIRIANDHSAWAPRLEIIDCFADPIWDGGAVALATDLVDAPGGSGSFQAVSVSYTNTSTLIKNVCVRVSAKHASGYMYENWTIDANYPAETDVRTGVNYNNGALEGTCDVPSPNDVEFGVAVDATTGVFVVPAEADVKDGVTFGAAAEFEGELMGGGGGRVIGSSIIRGSL